MNLIVRESNRWCVVEREARPTAAKLRRSILREENIQSGFSVLTAPAPAHDATLFKVVGNEKELLVGLCMLDSMRLLSPRADGAMNDSAEMYFDPLNDGIGWFQFLFNPPRLTNEDLEGSPHRDPELDDPVQINSHLPYLDAHSSACFGLRLKRHRVKDEEFTACRIATLRCRWLFAWFRTDEAFRAGGVCGFNICRSRPCLTENSSWNYCAGNGFPDASAFGRLYRSRAPAHVSDVHARLDGNTLRLQGRVSAAARGFSLELVTPTGDCTSLTPIVNERVWRVSCKIDPAVAGRYRLYPRCGSGPIEPKYLSVDVPSCARAASFCLSMTYDPPMCIISSYYTPKRLSREMEIWAGLGIKRIHWIEYGDWPSFWDYDYHWDRNWPRTRAECGDLLTCAARQAHRHGLEFIGDLKPFDLGINCFLVPADGVSTIEDIERRHVSVIPEIAAHQEWTMQSNPAWRRAASFPVTRLRMCSEAPIPRLRAGEVRVLTSRDNRRYARCRRQFTVRQGTLRRQHMRWTPAGNVRDSGARRNWYVELSGLDLTEPFLSVQLGDSDLFLVHRGHMLVEAWDAEGRAVPVTVATNGTTDTGFYFWKGWAGWNNVTEPILQVRKWNARHLGVVFEEAPAMPTLLEPAFEGARRIWLGRIRRILAGGADGVDIRSYCHHNGPMNYLLYAFAKPVRETFKGLYGREPSCTPEDYERVRRIRGDCYTEFMREAKRVTSGRGKKLIAELESGIEVPPSLDCRMQLPMDWRTWFNERIVDEVRLKWWTKDSTFIHEEVLPLARKRGIPVHVISRNLAVGFDVRTAEMGELVIGGACAAGFAGYSFYEQQNLMDMNPEGRATLKGPTMAYLEKARAVLDGMSR